MMSPRKAVVVISDHDLLDLEWIIPVIAQLKARGWGITTIIAARPDHTKHAFWLWLLHRVADQVDYELDAFEPLPRAVMRQLRHWRDSSSRWISRIATTYFGMRHPLLRYSGFIAWREGRRQANLEQLLAETSAILTVAHEHERPEGSVEQRILSAARRRDVPLALFPPVTDHDITLARLQPSTAVFANTPGQAEAWQKMTNARVTDVPPPKFEPAWREQLSQAFETFSNRRLVDDGRERILIILKNDTSVLWQGLQFEAVLRQLLESLAGPDRLLLLKPHPRQTMARLKACLSQFPPQHFQLVEGPLSYWIERADHIVSLFSGGVLDALASRKVATLYWPFTTDYAALLQAGAISEGHVRRNESGQFVTRYHGFAHEVTSENFSLPQEDAAPFLAKFHAHFNAPDGMQRICDELEALASLERTAA